MNDVKEKVINQICNMLNRTTDRGCTPAEEAAAIAKVNELLVAHNLSIVDVKATECKQYNVTHKCTSIMVRKFRSGQWAHNIANAVGRMCFVKFIGTYGVPEEATWVGDATNIEAAITLHEFLVEQAWLRMKIMWDTKVRATKTVSYLPFETAFMRGYADVVCSRIRCEIDERRKAAGTAENVTAIVRCADKENADYVHDTFTMSKRSPRQSKAEKTSEIGIVHGAEQGYKVPLHPSEALHGATI